jgi:hypothetical protein
LLIRCGPAPLGLNNPSETPDFSFERLYKKGFRRAPGSVMQGDLVSTFRRVIQVTVAGKIAAALSARVAAFGLRAGLSVGSAVLAAGASSLAPGHPSLKALADLALAVASSTLLQSVLASGGAPLALSLTHCCMVLWVGQALPLGHLADAFLGNTQFLFAQSVGSLLVATLPPAVAFISACALAGGARWLASRDEALPPALTQAAVFVLRGMLARAVPARLQLPTVAGFLCVSSEWVTLVSGGGLAEPLHAFVLFQAGESLNAALQPACGALPAVLAAVALACAAPIPVFATAAQMAAISAASDLAVRALAPVADTDPVLCLLPVLLFVVVFEAGLSEKNRAKPPGPPRPAQAGTG